MGRHMIWVRTATEAQRARQRVPPVAKTLRRWTGVPSLEIRPLFAENKILKMHAYKIFKDNLFSTYVVKVFLMGIII